MTLCASVFAVVFLHAASAAPHSTQAVENRAAAAAERSAQAAEQSALAAERIASAIARQELRKDSSAATGWAVTAGIGLTYFTGNTQSLTVTANFGLDKKWEHWALAVRVFGAYGFVTLGSANNTTARRAGGTIRGERTFGSGFASVFVTGGSELDHVKNIESRTFGDVGVGQTFFNERIGAREKLFLRLDLGLRVGYETRYQYFPVPAVIFPDTAIIFAPRVGIALRWAPGTYVRVGEELEVIPYVAAPSTGRVLVNSTSKLWSRLTDAVSITTALTVNYDSQPPQPPLPSPQRVPTDVTLTAGLEAVF